MTLADVVRWLEQAPGETLLPARSVLEMLRGAAPTQEKPVDPERVSVASWRERLWTVPPETRLGVAELSEAMGRPRSWIYRHTSARSGLPLLPHQKLDGELMFVASEIRSWIETHETSVVEPVAGVVPIARRRGRSQ